MWPKNRRRDRSRRRKRTWPRRRGSVNAFGGVNERLDDVFKMLVEAARLEARAVHMASGG